MTDVPRRPIFLGAVKDLIAAARSERARLPAASPERDFYLGAEAAADEVVHPELAMSRDEGWLDLRSSMFREGYVKTSTAIAAAQRKADVALHVSLPRPHAAH
jgi:hypothetical protein